jgi:peptidoglycan/LPS O-acetylase OafA/YrhL
LSIVIVIALIPFFPLVINRIPGGVVWSQWLSYFPFFWMAIGGLGAFVFHQFQERLEKQLVRFNLLGWLLSFGLLFWCMLFKVNDYFFGLMGLILILRSSIGHQWLPDKFPILPFIGRISFGIYIYHPLVMFLILSAFQYFLPNWHDVLYLKVMAYFLVIFASALLAWVSFRFFERPFIRLKDTRFGV